jgi:guanine deaminase
LSVGEVLYLATLGGAEVCDLHTKLGNFEVGKKFDAQLINLAAANTPVDNFGWLQPDNETERLRYQVERWFFNGDDRNCQKVWVNGSLVVAKH